MARASADAPNAYVRLTAPALDDLESLLKKDPQVVRWALKKMLLLERDPHAGAPLLGSLVGWRKLTVGDRDWRIIWRVTTDESGTITITIAEVWAVGARSEAEVYQEMDARVAAAETSPSTMALAEVIEMMGRHANRGDLSASLEPREDPVPDWLRDRLIHTAGLEGDEVEAMTGEHAMQRWEQYMTTGE